MTNPAINLYDTILNEIQKIKIRFHVIQGAQLRLKFRFYSGKNHYFFQDSLCNIDISF